jgi:tetratricopeptide (TPR) repeat protein
MITAVVLFAVMVGVAMYAARVLPPRCDLPRPSGQHTHERKQQHLTSLGRRARQAIKTGFFDFAEELLYQATGVEESSPELLRDLCMSLRAQGKIEKAKVIAERLVKYQPSPENLQLLADILYEFGKRVELQEPFQQSLVCYQTILDKHADDVDALRGLHEVYHALHLDEKAEEIAERLFGHDQSQRDIGMHLIAYYVEHNQLVDAQRVFEALLLHVPQDVELLERFAGLLLNFGQYERAAEYVERAQAITPSVSLSIKQAQSLYHLRRFEEAAVLFREAIKSEPEKAFLHYNLSLCLIAMKDYEAAHDNLKRAIDLNERDVRFHKTLAKVLLLLERKDEAIDRYEYALKLTPLDEESLRALIRLK